MKYTDYRDILQEELHLRKEANPSYSERAFARDLGITSPRLNNILHNKEGLSVEAAKEIASRLKLPEKKKKWFYLSAGSLHARSSKDRKEFKQKITAIKDEAKVFTEINLDYFALISEWYHFAILELTNLDQFKNDIDWIARTLGITVDQAATAIQRLKKLEILKEENGRLKSNHQFIATPNDVPIEALKQKHTEIIHKSLVAMRSQPVEMREFSANKMVIDRAQLPQLKERLKDLRREFVFHAEQVSSKNDVYCLSMQFFSLTQDLND